MSLQKRRGTSKFGWCLDDLHDRCIVTSVSGSRCGCPCHTDTPAPAHEGPSEPIGC